MFSSHRGPSCPTSLRLGGSSRELSWVIAVLAYLCCAMARSFLNNSLGSPLLPWRLSALIFLEMMSHFSHFSDGGPTGVSLTLLGVPWDPGLCMLMFLQSPLLGWRHGSCALLYRFRDWNPWPWLLLLGRRETTQTLIQEVTSALLAFPLLLCRVEIWDGSRNS